jgi:hypothetical protein
MQDTQRHVIYDIIARKKQNIITLCTFIALTS